MSIPLATRRLDGQNRFTLNLQFHPGRQELINVLVWFGLRHGPHVPESKMAMLDLARETFEKFGTHFEELVETANQRGSAEHTRLVAAAESAIDQLFPELRDRQVADANVHLTQGVKRYEERKPIHQTTKIGQRIQRNNP
jgi:hypothetical protein